MEKKLIVIDNSIFKSIFAKVTGENDSELLKELLNVNIQRETILSIVLIIIDVIMICSDIVSFFRLRPMGVFLNNTFYTHIALLLVPSMFLLLSHFRKTDRLYRNLKFKRTLHLLLNISVLLLCMYLSLNALLSKGQIYSYTIAIFCIASMVLFTTTERLFIYLSSYIAFIIGILIIRNSIHELLWNLFFVTLLAVIALIASSSNYSAYVKNFYNQRIILEKSLELDNTNKKIEEALIKRTEELTETNERLISEIKAKHEIEIQFIKTAHLCEEKERVLNETVEYEKLRTAFFANISHELRTPLTVIFSAEQMLDYILNTDNIQDSKKEIKQYVNIIRQNCYRLIRLIANLIDITKIDAGYFQVNLKNHDIVNVVEEITLSVAKYIEDKNLNLIFDTEIEEKVIACDPDKIERIILNLLSNAVKFTPEGGEIFVNIIEGDGKIILSIRDTGLGIPLEMQSKIFDRFVQVDKTTSRRSEGSGIGLSLVKSIIDMHNGTVSLISECGKGSEFIIELPDRIIPSEITLSEDNKLAGSSNIERINVEFSDIYL